ncbi:MAG: trypsin-like peptidase domain-containing protein [Planctomycetes bacterium]|nr:trypsin-like peptidase domain-containing protein [Planctomycetota bacterium]
MNRIISALALSMAVGGFALSTSDVPAGAQAKGVATPNVTKLDDETRALVAKVYPAFVLIGGGSGVCISEDGYFLTNHHVWNDAAAPAEMVVKQAGNNKRFTADAIGADPRGDIVLGKLRLDPGQKVPFVTLGDSDKVEPGSICLSVGNPFLLSGQGSEPTVTIGTVTANHRFQGGYNDSIQIDTSINPGNSGGPSFNMDGEVIGINGRNIASHGKRFNTGAGYAIPANQIKNFIPVMKEQLGGALLVRHGFVGGLSFDLKHQGGARITAVELESEAGDVGFEANDVIQEIDGYEIFNAYRYYGVIGTKPRGSEFKFKVLRGEKTVMLTARNNVPSESGQFGNIPRADDIARAEDRRSGNNPLRRMMDPFALPDPKSSIGFKGKYNPDRKVGGYVLTEVVTGGPLETGGLQAEDVLTHVNGRHIQYYCDLGDILIAKAPGTEVTVTWLRGGEKHEAKVKLAKK